jgi:hypothetical protein
VTVAAAVPDAVAGAAGVAGTEEATVPLADACGERPAAERTGGDAVVGDAVVRDGAGGGVTAVDGAGDGGRTAALTAGIPDPTPASLTTTFAPNQATLTAIAVPAAQAATPAMTRIMLAIMPQAIRRIRTVRVMARVLIVEDDPYVRSAMTAELTRRSYVVRTAGTALDGIREVSHHLP